MQTIEYKNGRMNGTTTKYKWRPYKIVSEIDFKEGVKDGKMVMYDKRGRKVVQKYFKEGVEVREDGKPVKFQP